MSTEPVWPAEEPVPEARVPVALRSGRPPKRKTISGDIVFDTAPIGRGRAVVHALPETAATGLRKFDLGNVPASVTPPRSWRRAAWFAVGTSAAVVLGLTVAAAEFMGRPVSDNTIIDALPEYPPGPLTLEKLPDHDATNTAPGRPTTSSHGRTPSESPDASSQQEPPPRDTVTGDTTTGGTTTVGTTTGDAPSQGTTTTTPDAPSRRTVGPAPIAPTDPQEMGDRTVEYFRLVTSDPEAAHTMTTGDMAREGTEGIEARYGDVERVEVQDITIDRNQATTTSTVRIVREDGTETVERRRLTFTWGGDPKITDDAITQ